MSKYLLCARFYRILWELILLRCHALLTRFSGLLAKHAASHGSSWFALNAHAFHGQIIDGQDGYTILWVPGGLRDTSTGSPVAQSGGEEKQQMVKDGYVLWEFSNVYPITG